MLKTLPVPQHQTTEPNVLINAIQSRLPIKISGLLENWPASQWTFELLKARIGAKKVKVLLDIPQAGGIFPGGQDKYEHIMTFTELIEHAQCIKAPPCYLGFLRIHELLHDNTKDLDFSSLTPKSNEPTDTRLWLGSANTCSGLHSDLKDNVFAQIKGRKRVFLVPFEQTRLVYPFIDNIVNSQVDPENYSYHKFPKFISADVMETYVEPGDILFIPRGWWHYLRSLAPSISINHWFGKPVPAFTYLRLLVNLGPRYIKQTVMDMIRYSLLSCQYRRDFFFSPPSTGERLFNLLRHGDFSRRNNPTI